jgi:signal transduction histidine kinase
VVANQVDRLARMADDLLDMARMDAGRLELRLHATDLGVVAGECVELYRLVSDAHRLVLRVPDRPIVAVCDPDRLAQVLNNLIGNAIKYSADGGEVTVRLEHDGDDVVIAVADTGPGIDAAQAERIFDLFQRLADARGPIPGEGLGLWNARRILAAHGGTIRVRSTSGRGATFEVRLPGAAGGLPAPATAARATGSP